MVMAQKSNAKEVLNLTETSASNAKLVGITVRYIRTWNHHKPGSFTFVYPKAYHYNISSKALRRLHGHKFIVMQIASPDTGRLHPMFTRIVKIGEARPQDKTAAGVRAAKPQPRQLLAWSEHCKHLHDRKEV